MNQTAFGILALRAAGAASGSSRSAAWLRSIQNSDGGWGFAAGVSSDADTTGAVLQGLAASGNRAGIRRGVSYLRGAQRAGGGFPLSGGVVNAQSTAYAVQGLIAGGSSPSSVRVGGRSALDYLGSLQAGDGHYRYSATSDQTPVWVTGQALLAVSGKDFPLSPVPRSESPPVAGASAGASIAPAHTGDGAKAKPGRSDNAKPAPVRTTTMTATTPTATAPPISPVSTRSNDDGGGGIPGWLIALALVALGCGAIWGGWLLYRRRLPS